MEMIDARWSNSEALSWFQAAVTYPQDSSVTDVIGLAMRPDSGMPVTQEVYRSQTAVSHHESMGVYPSRHNAATGDMESILPLPAAADNDSTCSARGAHE